MEVRVRAADWSSVCHICLSTDRRTWGLDHLSGAYIALTGCLPLEGARVCFECRAELERFMRLRTRGQTAQWLIMAAQVKASTETIIGKCMSRLAVQHIYTYSVNFDSEIDHSFNPSDDDSHDFKVPIIDTDSAERAPEYDVWAEPGLRYNITVVPIETVIDEKTPTKQPAPSRKKPHARKAKNKLGLPELKANENCESVSNDDDMIEMFTPTEEQLANYRMHVLSSSNNFKFICITCREGFEHKAEMMKHDEKYHSEAAGVHRCDICASRFPTPDELEQHRAAHYRMWRCLYTGCDFVHACRSTMSSHLASAPHERGDKSNMKPQDKNMSDKYTLKVEPDSCGSDSDYEVPLETGSASDEGSVTDVDEESMKSTSFARAEQSKKSIAKSVPSKEKASHGKKLKDGSVEMLSATDEQLAAYREYLYARLNFAGSKLIKCVTCLEEFRCGENLEKHNETYHSEAAGAHWCDICASRFPSTGALEKHRAAHYRMWRCLYPGCSYVHTRKTTVTRHRLLHDNCRKPKDKNASVDNSPGVSDTEHEEFSHTAVLPGTALSRNNNRVAAKTVTIDETVGQSNSSLLERNATHDDRMEMFTVTEEQLAAYRSKILKSLKHWSYICVKCLSRFSCEEKMMEHKEKFHSEEIGPHQCDICTRRFPSPDELTPHRARHYRLWRCLIAGCDYLHARKDTLLWHLAHAPHKPPEESPIIGQCVYNIVDEEASGSSSKPRQPKKGTKPKSKRRASIEKFVATEETLKSYRNYLRKRLKNPKTRKCMPCLLKFRSDGFLKKHIKKYHSEAAGAHRCDICECRFLTEEELAEHRARHYNMWRCSRPGCGYMHNLRTYVSSHNLQHDGVRKSRAKPRAEPPKGPFECDICGKVFERRRKIFIHMKNHRKRCMCEVCGYTCSKLSQLKNHILAHLEPSCRPYQCEHCNKGFIDQHRLDVHIRLHTGEQPFQCVVCYSKFMSKEALQEHVQDRHSEGQTVSAKPQQFECYECGKTFKFRSLLKNHILFQHKGEKPFQCNVCGAKFTKKTQVSIHMSSHSDAKLFKCDLCEASYKYLAGLWSHKLIHTALKQHQCTTCGSRFTLKGNLVEHMKTHTNERPFECNVCEKKFIRKRNLKNHLKTHS